MNAVLWGCRIRCSAPGCNRHTDIWSDQGTPPLPFAGAPSEGPLKGWFLQYLNGVDYRPTSWKRGHVAFCPEHSVAALEWKAAFWKWKNERSQVGKTTALSWADRLAEWLSPSEKRNKFNMAVYDAVNKWDKTHPSPVPPWSKYASVNS